MKKVLNKKIISLIVIFAVSFFVFSFNNVLAFEIEGYGAEGSVTDLILKTNNDMPNPGENVSLSLENYSANLYTSQISWYKNNILVEKGLGKTKFSFDVGGLGSVDTITVVVISKEGRQFTKNMTFRPAEVDMIWESDSYTSPFYKGKTMFPYRSVVKMVALPNFINFDGSKIDESELMYVWKRNWKIINESQGVGKNVLYFDTSKNFRNNILSVEVSTVDGAIKAKKSIELNEAKSKLLFYENDPLLGIIFEKALDKNLDLMKDEITISAQPFFFSRSDINSDNLVYKWRLNGGLVDNIENFITLKKNEDKGRAVLNLSIQNKNKVMQSAVNSLNINFDDKNESLFNF